MVCKKNKKKTNITGQYMGKKLEEKAKKQTKKKSKLTTKTKVKQLHRLGGGAGGVGMG